MKLWSSSAPDIETRKWWRSGDSKLLSGDEVRLRFLMDNAALGWKALLASCCNGTKLSGVSMTMSLKLQSVPLADVLAMGSRDRSGTGSNTELLSVLLSGLRIFPRLVIGWSTLDFFLASTAAFETSSALRGASDHGLIFTAPGGFLLVPSSFLAFLPVEFCGMSG